MQDTEQCIAHMAQAHSAGLVEKDKYISDSGQKAAKVHTHTDNVSLLFPSYV